MSVSNDAVIHVNKASDCFSQGLSGGAGVGAAPSGSPAACLSKPVLVDLKSVPNATTSTPTYARKSGSRNNVWTVAGDNMPCTEGLWAGMNAYSNPYVTSATPAKTIRLTRRGPALMAKRTTPSGKNQPMYCAP